MRPAAACAVLGAASLVGGCVYLNALYNAERLFDDAERATWEGRHAEARPLYDSVVAKSARSYRKEPEGGWADDALYLLGRAYLRLGEPGRAEPALRRILERSDDEALRAGALLHLGIAAASRGRRAEALTYLNDALRNLRRDDLRAEGHLWRGRILLESGRTEAGWWDLDQAAAADERYRVSAGLERLRWGVAHGDTARAREGASRLLGRREAHVREDTLRTLLGRAARRWGPATAAGLLAGAEASAWPPSHRDRALLERARYRFEAGDEEGAVADAGRVAGGAGPEVTEARLLLARIRLRGARTVEELEPARAVLLPAVGDPRVLELLESVRRVGLLAERGEGGEGGEPDGGAAEALFAAAEIARDELEAPRLARSLFLGYADRSARPWAGKALLAALDLTRDPQMRRPLLRRLARMRNDPYVAAGSLSAAPLQGEAPAAPPPPRVRELDARLQEVLDGLLAWATDRARELDVLARERSDTAGTAR